MALKVEMTGNATGFAAMLASAKTQTKAAMSAITEEAGRSWGGIGKSLVGGIAGAISFEGLKEALVNFAETGKAIREQAEQLDMSTDAWQKWKEAVEKAGLSTEAFQRIVETLHEKRTAALTDPKARAELSRLGFSDAEISGNMSMSDFTKKALGNANGDDFQRKALSDVIGNRGLKYATALPNFDSADTPFSKDDLKDAEELSNVFRELSKVAGQLTLGFVHILEFINPFDRSRKTQQGRGEFIGGLGAATENVLGSIIGKGWLWGKYRSVGQTGIDVGQWAVHNYKPEPKAKPEPTEPTHDPMDDALKAQKEEMALHEQERQQRLAESQRSLMTIGDRRANLAKEAAGLTSQIADRNKKMHGEDFLTDAQKNQIAGVTGKAREFQVNKYRTSYQDETDNLQMRLDKDKGELRQKPLSFQADSMAKVGLYSASALSFNPVLGIAREQLSVLKVIATNTAPRNSVTKPLVNSFGDKVGTKPAGGFHPGGGDAGAGHGAGGSW